MKKRQVDKLHKADLHKLFKEFLIERNLLDPSDGIELHEISFIANAPTADGRICVEWEQRPVTIQTPNGPVVVFQRTGRCLRWAEE